MKKNKNRVATGNSNDLTGLFAIKNKVVLCLETDIRNLIARLLSFKFSGNDKKDVRETFCLYVFLIGCFKSGLLAGDIKITRQESPDFVLYSIPEGLETGLELTRATLGSFQVALKKFRDSPDRCLLELSHYSPSKPLSNKNAGIGIIAPGGKLSGKCWKGDEAELEWAEIMFSVISKKNSLLGKGHFQKKQENQLFVEDDTPVDFFKDDETAFKILRERYSGADFSKTVRFQKVHIFSNCILHYDFFGNSIAVDIHKAHLQEFFGINVKQATGAF